MYKVKPNVGMMFKFQFHYENGERVDLQKATNAIVEIRTVDSSSNITSSFADDFGYDLTNNCMWVRFSADAVVTVGNVVSANLTVQIRNTTGAYEYITTAAFVNLFVISNDDDASSVNGVIIDKPVKLSAAGLSITAHSPYINADGYWVYYSDDNKTWIVSTYKATNDVIVDKDSVTHLKDGAGNGSLVSTNDDKSSAGNTAVGLNCISLGSKNSNAGTSDVVLLGNGNRAKSSAINAVGVAGADVDASVAFAVGQGRTGDHGYPKNVFAISPFGDISYRPSTDTDRLANLQNTLNLGFINNLSYNKTSKKISYYVYTPNENFPSEHEQHTIDLSTLVSGDKTVTDTTYNSATNEITVTYNDGSVETITLTSIQSDWSTTDTSADSYILNKPTALSSFVNDSGYDTVTSVNSKLANYLPLAGGALTGDLTFSDSGTSTRGIYGTVGSGDAWRIIGGASAPNSGWLELATGDDAIEPIYVRQYFHIEGTTPYSYFGKIIRTATLLDAYGNTSFPGTVTASAFSGNASSATKLNTARNIGLSGVTSTAQSFDGSANITIPITAVPGSILTGTTTISTTGNADTATKLANARTITLTGNTTGKGSFDGSDNLSIATTTSYATAAGKLNTARNIGLSGVIATTQSFDGTNNITIPITAVPAALLTGTASISTTGNATTSDSANYIKSNTWNWSGVGSQGAEGTVRKIASITGMSYLEIDGGNMVGNTETKGIVKISMTYIDGLIISNNSTVSTNFGYVITSTTSGRNGKVNIDLYLQERSGENYYNILVSKFVGSAISFESPSAEVIPAPAGYVAIS